MSREPAVLGWCQVRQRAGPGDRPAAHAAATGPVCILVGFHPSPGGHLCHPKTRDVRGWAALAGSGFGLRRPWPLPLMIGFRRRGRDRKRVVATGLPHGHVVAVCPHLLTRPRRFGWARRHLSRLHEVAGGVGLRHRRQRQVSGRSVLPEGPPVEVACPVGVLRTLISDAKTA
jgi:hypothetical protein